MLLGTSQKVGHERTTVCAVLWPKNSNSNSLVVTAILRWFRELCADIPNENTAEIFAENLTKQLSSRSKPNMTDSLLVRYLNG